MSFDGVGTPGFREDSPTRPHDLTPEPVAPADSLRKKNFFVDSSNSP